MFKQCILTKFGGLCKQNGFELEMFNKSENLPAEWDEFSKEHSYLQKKVLHALECSNLNDIEYCYLLIRKQKKIVGLFYFQILTLRNYHYDKPAQNNSKLVNHIEEVLLARNYKIWVCGNLFKTDFRGFVLNEHHPDSVMCLKAIKDFTGNLSSKEKPRLILFKDVDASQEFSKVFKDLRFKSADSDIVMKMDVDSEWNNLNDYANKLSKKYLARYKKTRKDIDGIERRELDVKSIERYGFEILDLYNQVVKKQSIRLGLLNPEYFLNCKKCFGNQFTMYGYFKGDKMVGFTSNFCIKKEWEIHYIGFDYEENKKHKLYLNFLFDGLNDAIVHKCKKLNLGRTAKEAKASLGAKPVFYQNYYKLNGTTSRLIYNYLETRFNESESEDWKQRNPFK